MTLHILYYRFLSPDGSEASIGGIQTYIHNLGNLILDLGHSVSIYQIASTEFHTLYNGFDVYGVMNKKGSNNRANVLLAECMNHFDVNSDVLIWGTEELVKQPAKNIRSIAIQHGIYWDKPVETNSGLISSIKNKYRLLQTYKNTMKYVEIPAEIVCVDFNFVNWYRASSIRQNMKYHVIPNFTALPEENFDKHIEAEKVKIIFARRFWKYRGTRLFCVVMKRLLQEGYNIDVTIAGDGPDEGFLRQELGNNGNVHFIRYKSEESLMIHKDKHISIIPTLGSEGTSLSLLEGMAASCAVVCTNIGGMTNIVIDQFNGLMVQPNENSLYNAVKQLIEDEKQRKQLAKNAYETVKSSFNINIWRDRWKNVIQNAEDGFIQNK